jgi:putative ABC transport system permease protein
MKAGAFLWESLRMAADALRKNKLRSVLSVLGITIGIYCIIVVYALVHSMEKNINDNFASFGTDVLFVQKWPWDEFGGNYPWWKYLRRPETSVDEARFLEENLDKSWASAIAFAFSSAEKIEYRGVSLTETRVNSVSHRYNEVQKADVEYGRYFTDDESAAGRPVCIIGATVAQNLFQGVDPLGKDIRIKNQVCRVIGVFRREGQSIINASADERVMIPLKLGMGIMNYKENSEGTQILLKASPGIALDDLSFETSQLMRRYRRIGPYQEATFSVNRMSMITNAVSDLFGTIKVIGVIIGGFSMVVGCFGVANIMFVSVKERTQEIGIQKALGARRSFILAQFLTESVILCIIGGLIGLTFVWATLQLLNFILQHQLDSGFILYLMPNDVILGIGVSVLVGLLAGFLPASSGAGLNPVDAIRSK